jgi:hypothetical protein
VGVRKYYSFTGNILSEMLVKEALILLLDWFSIGFSVYGKSRWKVQVGLVALFGVNTQRIDMVFKYLVEGAEH